MQENEKPYPWVWDYALGREEFDELLAGHKTLGRLNQDWAAKRLLEYAPYAEIIRLLGYDGLLEGWPRWRQGVRSESRRRGFDFLARWLPEHHPEWINYGKQF